MEKYVDYNKYVNIIDFSCYENVMEELIYFSIKLMEICRIISDKALLETVSALAAPPWFLFVLVWSQFCVEKCI